MVRFHLWLHPSQSLVRLGGHQLVQACAAGEAVFKGHNIPGAANQAAASRHIGDVAKLVFGNVQKPCQFIPVGGGLVEKD